MQNGAGRVHPAARWRGHDLLFAAPVRGVAAHRLPVQQANRPILPTLGHESFSQQNGRRRTDVAIALRQLFRIRGREVAEELRGVSVQLERRVGPVRAAIPWPVPRGNEDVSGGRVHDRAGAPPDGRTRAPATLRIEELALVAAEGVPDMLKLAGARVEYGDVSLVGWGVTNVAAGDRDHRAMKERERRGNLLASRQPGNGRAPERVTVGNGELLDVAIGRRGVNGL